MLSIIITIVVVVLDQLSKLACANALELGEKIDVMKGVFSISYVENRGAAFGMLQNAQPFFIIITVIACAALVYFMIREYKRMPVTMHISLALILSGAIGNFIDRVALGYVRDMLYFELIDFPVFNVADSAICVGAAILILDVLFFKGKTFLNELEKKPTDGESDSENNSTEE